MSAWWLLVCWVGAGLVFGAIGAVFLRRAHALSRVHAQQSYDLGTRHGAESQVFRKLRDDLELRIKAQVVKEARWN